METDLQISCRICELVLRTEHINLTTRATLYFPTKCPNCGNKEINGIDTEKLMWAAFLGANEKLLPVM